MAVGKGAANFMTSLVSSMIEYDQRAKQREEERKQQLEDSQRRIREALQMERYKSGLTEYERHQKLADQMEAAGPGSGAAQVYFSGLVGLPLDAVREDTNPATETGKKNVSWFEDEKNYKAVISYLRGYQKPTFDFGDDEFEAYRTERATAKNELARNIRNGTGYSVHRVSTARDPDQHEMILNELIPGRQSGGVNAELERLGLSTPTLQRGEPAPPAPRQQAPMIYYKPDGGAVRAFTEQEAREYESRGYSASAPVAAVATQRPITLYKKGTTESKDFRPGDPAIDPLINSGEWTQEKPATPTRVRNIMPSEGKQIENFITAFADSDDELYSHFSEVWDEADSQQRLTVKTAIFSRVSELRAMPENQDIGLEPLTSMAIQDLGPRLKVVPGGFTDAWDDQVVLEPEAQVPPKTEMNRSADEPKVKQPVGPNEELRKVGGRPAVFNKATKAFIRYADE